MSARRERLAEVAAWVSLPVVALLVRAGTLRAAYYCTDWELYFVPVRAFFDAGLRAGVLRWWAGEVGAGFPLHAEGQGGLLYLPNWLTAWLTTPGLAVSWSVALHAGLAMGGVYALLRRLDCGRLPAVIGGWVYGLGGMLAARDVLLPFYQGLCWLPWLTVGLELGLRRRTGGWVLAGVALAMQLLASHAHPPLLSGLLAPVYVLARWPALAPERQSGGRVVLGLAAVFLIGGGLAAPQVLPLLELAGGSVRSGGLTAAERSAMPIEPWQLYTLVAPTLHGTPYMVDLSLRDRYHLVIQADWCLYLGIAPLLLALLAPWLGRRRERWLFVGLLLAAALLAAGDRLPFYGWLARLPGWSSVRAPSRLSGLMALAAAVLCGLTVDDLARDGIPQHRRRPLAVVLAAAAATAGLAVLMPLPTEPAHRAWFAPALDRAVLLGLLAPAAVALRAKLSPGVWLAALAVLVLGDLGTGLRAYQSVTDPEHYAPPPEAARVAASGRRVLARTADGGPLSANRSLLYPGVDNVALYSPLKSPQLRRIEDLITAGWPAARTWLTLLRVGYASARQLRVQDDQPNALVEATGSEPAPYAWLTATAVAVPGPAAALDKVSSATWRPFAETVRESGDPVSGGTGRIGRVVVGRHRVEVRVTNIDRTVLVLSQAAWPGWRVLRDSAWRPAERLDALLLGAVLEPGDGWVRLVYQPAALRLGLFVSLLTLTALMGGGCYTVTGRRGRRIAAG